MGWDAPVIGTWALVTVEKSFVKAPTIEPAERL